MNKTPYFHKPIHTASARKREIKRVFRLIQVVKCVRELKRETVRELFFFSFCQDHTSSLSLRFHNLKSQVFFFNGIFWNMPKNILGIFYGIFRIFVYEGNHPPNGFRTCKQFFFKEDLQPRLKHGYRSAFKNKNKKLCLQVQNPFDGCFFFFF